MTKEPTDMDEAELRILLQRGERTVTPSLQQRDRIRDRIDQELEVERMASRNLSSVLGRESDSAVEPVEPIELVWEDPRPRTTVRLLLASAAILAFAVVGLAVFANIRGNSVVSVADPQEASPSAAAPACPAEITEFLEAIDLWGGVENWSFVTDASAPEPDLLTLALAVLDLEAAAPELANEAVAEQLESLREVSLANRELRPVDRQERFEAVSAVQLAIDDAAMNSRQLSNCSVGNR